MDWHASWDVFARLDHEALKVVTVVPSGFSRSLMIKHICQGNERVGLDLVNGDAKDPTCNNHPHLGVLFQVKLLEGGHLEADEVVVLLNFLNFLFYLIDKSTSLKPLLLILREKDGELGDVLRQQVDVGLPRRAFLLDLLEHVRAQEVVLWRDQPLPESFLVHQLAKRRVEGHLECDKQAERYEQNLLSHNDVSLGVHAAIILVVVN